MTSKTVSNLLCSLHLGVGTATGAVVELADELIRLRRSFAPPAAVSQLRDYTRL